LVFAGGLLIDLVVEAPDAAFELDDAAAEATADFGEAISEEQYSDQCDEDEFTGTGPAESEHLLEVEHI
jgi:hypothetical protein